MDIIAQYVPDLFAPIIAAVSIDMNKTVQYRWGHRTEVDQELKGLDASKTKQAQKYPMIWLVMDFDEMKGDNMDVYTKGKFSFIFVVDTQPTWSEQQRRDNTFKPILLPMYESFINWIGQSTTFRMPDPSQVKHTFRLRPYWGQGKINLFGDFCDCIEIINLSLDIRRLNCKTT